MNNIITKIEIDSFRSIRREIIEADNINIFSGLNDVGKSNVLKAINLFFNRETDFGVGFNFDLDYSKVSLAAAQRSNKKKQQVRIKIHFNVPASFKSLVGERVSLERVFDRSGNATETYSHDDPKKRASITRLANKIKFYYIPALKGPEVLRFILGEVGKRQLVADADIKVLNDKVNDNVKDLAGILFDSAIKNETRFELPVLVRDFWEKLNIHTAYDQFSELDKEINPSAKGKRNLLRKEYYQVPLLLRGDGIKSKFIPPLLQWIQQHDDTSFYVWGIDEPENSLEFKKAQEVANLYFSKYAKTAQLFMTSHSLAFIFTDNHDVSILRCYKNNLGETKFEDFNDLFKESHKFELAEEIGALEIQKEFYKEWRDRDSEITELNNTISSITRSVVFVEGEIDESYLKMTLDIFGLSDFNADIKPIGYMDENGKAVFSGKDNMEKAERFLTAQAPHHKVVLFYDVDCEKSCTDKGNLTIFCPKRIDSAKYTTGIEHLLVIPDNFDVNATDFIKTKKSGDAKTIFPDKKKILDHVTALTSEEKKAWLINIKTILDELKLKI